MFILRNVFFKIENNILERKMFNDNKLTIESFLSGFDFLLVEF